MKGDSGIRAAFDVCTEEKNRGNVEAPKIFHIGNGMLIQKNVSLRDKNWFKTGGEARFYAEPTGLEEVVAAVKFAQREGLAIFILGEGANILISDEGFDGLVLRPKNDKISIDVEQGLIIAEAGVSVPELIEMALEHNLLGLEEFSGIPGTVGGSVFINIHYCEFLLSQFLASATVINLRTGESKEVGNDWFGFGYNQSALQNEKWYLFDATFQLKKATDVQVAYARGRRHEIIRHRNRRYPLERTCGSFFRNFLPEELPFTIAGKKVPFVGYYLEKVGVKGELMIGGAMVYHLHANMLVTKEGATSADVIAVARTMQEKVRDQFGIVPQPECQLIGFAKNPLL